jgi:dihydrofolate reductase
MRKIVSYIAASLDGKIAGPDDDLSWLDEFNSPENDYGYKDFMSSVDTTIMGNRTYRKILTFDFPYKDKQNFVFTQHQPESVSEYVTFIDQNQLEFIRELKKKEGKNIWLIGGGKMNTFFLKNELLDELILFVIPVILGAGIPLFETTDLYKRLSLVKFHRYSNGVTELNYHIHNA